MSSINSGIWDTHVHVLNPVQFPFKSSRTYTPEVASLDQLISSSPATNFLLVQASVEDGPDAILHHLDLARRTYPDREFRAEIEVGDDDDDFDGDDDQKLKDLHSRGVRALRLHGVVGISTSTTVDDPTSYIQSRFKRLAKIAARTGWYISAMCPLTTWLALEIGSFPIRRCRGARSLLSIMPALMRSGRWILTLSSMACWICWREGRGGCMLSFVGLIGCIREID